MKFSANLGFLFTDHALPEAIRAAAAHGFNAVECHWPYDTPAEEVREALRATGLPLIGINTVRGGRDGDFGLSAVPGRQDEARAAIDQAIGYCVETGCRQVHVLAGIASGAKAFDIFAANLDYACSCAGQHGIGIVVEPLNTRDVPGYFLHSTVGADDLLDTVGAGNLKIMFDCYHMQIMQGDLLRSVAELMPRIGHIQIASVPDRSEPDGGEIDYGWLLPRVTEAGYSGWFGAEYRPRGKTEDGLGWINRLRPTTVRHEARPDRGDKSLPESDPPRRSRI
jgi:hydroxypyruvate isomerase